MYPTASRRTKNYDTRAYYAGFQADLCTGRPLFFVCTKIIDNKYVGDVKAPLLRVIDSKQLPETLVYVSLNQLIKYFPQN